VEEALAGASDIIAEMISDDADIRGMLREYIMAAGSVSSEGTSEEDSVYRLYYDFSERISRLKGHQVRGSEQRRKGRLSQSRG